MKARGDIQANIRLGRRGKRRLIERVAGLAATSLVLSLLAVPTASAGTYGETAGGAANTWSDYNSAGGTQGPTIGSNQTVQIACKVQGFRVQDGNTNWYRIAQDPWNNNFYVSADAFYNNGATSGSLAGTPFVDPAVPDCSSLPVGVNETAGGAANTWTDFNSAGGTQGPSIGAQQTVAIECKLTGFRVQDGNTWWYRVASAPWNSAFYVSADAFYNNGVTSGSLVGTPFVDNAVPDCVGLPTGGAGGTKAAQAVQLSQGPAAPVGYRYAISLTGFAASAAITINCFDSVSPGGFYSFSIQTNSSGAASTQSYCYSGDGPDHWVTAGGITSNHVTWNNGGASGGVVSGGSPPATGVSTIVSVKDPGSHFSDFLLVGAQRAVDGVTLGSPFNSSKWHAYGPNNTCMVRDYNTAAYGHVMVIKYDNNAYHMVRTGMLYGWWDNGGASGALGCAIGKEETSTTVSGVRFVYQQFQNGYLYWSSKMTGHAVRIDKSGLDAISWAWNQIGSQSWPGRCLEFVVSAYKLGAGIALTGGPYNGWNGPGSEARAYQWWTSRPASDQNRGTDVPPGAFAIWNPSAALDGSGHIVLSIGGGWAVSTETSGSRTEPVHVMQISSWAADKYYGWVSAK